MIRGCGLGELENVPNVCNVLGVVEEGPGELRKGIRHTRSLGAEMSRGCGLGRKLEERSWRDHKNWIWELKKSRKARRRSRKLEEGRERQ